MDSSQSNSNKRFNKSSNVNSSSSEDDIGLGDVGNTNFLAGLSDLSKDMPSNSSSNASKSTSSSSSEDDIELGGLGNADFLAGLGYLSKDVSSSSLSSSKENSMMRKASMARVSMANSIMAKESSDVSSIKSESTSASASMSSVVFNKAFSKASSAYFKDIELNYCLDFADLSREWSRFYHDAKFNYSYGCPYDDSHFINQEYRDYLYTLRVHFVNSTLSANNRFVKPESKYAPKINGEWTIKKIEQYNRDVECNLYDLFNKSVYDRKHHIKNIANNLFHNFLNFINYYYSTHNSNSLEKPLGYVNYKQEKEKLGQQLIVLDRAYEDSDLNFLKKYHFYSGSNILKYHMKITNKSKIHAEDLYCLRKSIFADKNGKFSYTIKKYSKRDLMKIAKHLFDKSKNTIFKDNSMLLNTQCYMLSHYFNRDSYFFYNLFTFADISCDRTFNKPLYISHYESKNFLNGCKFLFRAINAFSNRYTGQGPSYLFSLGILMGLNKFKELNYNYSDYLLDSVQYRNGHIIYMAPKKITYHDFYRLIRLMIFQALANGVGKTEMNDTYDWHKKCNLFTEYRFMRDY